MDVSGWVAVASLLLATASIMWQVVTWLNDGRRLRVRLLHGAEMVGGFAVGRVRNGVPNPIERVRVPGGLGREVLGVEVMNVGRSRATISSYSCEVDGAPVLLTPHRDAIGPQRPFRLEPGERECWYVEMDAVRALFDASSALRRPRPRPRARARIVIETGAGRKIPTREWMRLL